MIEHGRDIFVGAAVMTNWFGYEWRGLGSFYFGWIGGYQEWRVNQAADNGLRTGLTVQVLPCHKPDVRPQGSSQASKSYLGAKACPAHGFVVHAREQWNLCGLAGSIHSICKC